MGAGKWYGGVDRSTVDLRLHNSRSVPSIQFWEILTTLSRLTRLSQWEPMGAPPTKKGLTLSGLYTLPVYDTSIHPDASGSEYYGSKLVSYSYLVRIYNSLLRLL